MSSEVISKLTTLSVSSTLIFLVLIGFTIGNVFEINRTSSLSFWERGGDVFKVPTAICNRTSIGDICGLFHANVSSESCTCFCPTSRSNFVFYDSQWRCLDNFKFLMNFQGTCKSGIFNGDYYPRSGRQTGQAGC